MKNTPIFAATLLIGLLTAPLAAEQTCERRLQAVNLLTSHSTLMAMQLDYHSKNGDGTQEGADAVKQEWLKGAKQGYAQLDQIIEDCERQAKQTKDPTVAAPLLAVVFNAKLAKLGTADHPRIYADAIATISSVDRHDETDAVVPFLVTAGMNTWRDDPEESKLLMQRALDLAEKHYGKVSPKRADILASFASIYSPVEVSPGDRSPHADAKRAEKFYSEALTIYEQHPEAMATYEYSGLVLVAAEFYRKIGNAQRANALDARHSELKKTEREN